LPESLTVRRAPPPDSERLLWERDGADWPNRAASRFVVAGGLRWHVQVMGQGPVLLLLHGTGAATHSWRDLAPCLAGPFTVIAPDLPGHGFTAMPGPAGLSLPGMAASIQALLRELGFDVAHAVGHSAGAAILVQLGLEEAIRPKAIIALNGALLPISGLAGRVFSPMAKILASLGPVPHFFARCAEEPAMVPRLLRDTGSRLDAAGIQYYARLARSPGHVAAALGMMAQWDLQRLRQELPLLRVPLHLVVGGADRTIAPSEAFRIRDRLPGSVVTYLRGLGHLAHEEAPEKVADLIRKLAEA